jgi:spore maturation protein CgeB
MKILHVAVFSPNSTNIWQADAFEQLGCEVIRFDYRKVAAEIGLDDRDMELVGICKDERPDITLFSKCNMMHVNVVKACNRYSTTMLWMMDNWNNMDQELIDKVIHCDIAFFAGWRELEWGKSLNKNSFKLHGGYDPKLHHPIDTEKIYNVTFIGNIHPYRKKYVGLFKHIEGVYNLEHSKVVSQSRINLNFVEGSGPSNRMYKIMAAGGFLLTNPWENLDLEFTPGIDFDIFENPLELKEKIDFYLKNPGVRETIAKQGHKTIKKYDNINYAKTIIEKYNEFNLEKTMGKRTDGS